MKYRNDYSPPVKQAVPTTDEELHLYTPRRKYDLNFAGGRVREMCTDIIVLMPYNPHEHAVQLSAMLTKYPEVRQRRRNQMSTVQEVLEWSWGAQHDSGYCYWSIFFLDEKEQLFHPDPPIHTLAGVVGLEDFDPHTLTVSSGCYVFPPFQRMDVASQAVALLQTFAFTHLGVVRFHSRTMAGNMGVIRLGERLSFKREQLSRGCLGYGPPTKKTFVPGKEDPRSVLQFDDALHASITWKEWSLTARHYSEAIRCNLSSPIRFRNDYTPAVKTNGQGALGRWVAATWSLFYPNSDLQLYTPPEKYDHNFIGEVKELCSRKVFLAPFVPSLHSKDLHKGLLSDPSTYTNIDFDRSLAGKPPLERSVRGILEYLEGFRKNPICCVWAIYDTTMGSEARHPRSSDHVGMVVLQGDTSNAQSSVVGPLVIFNQAQRKYLATHTLALIACHVFAPREKLPNERRQGLGQVRLSFRANPMDTASISLVESLGFIREGVARFVIPPVRPPGEKVDMFAAMEAIQRGAKGPDPREEYVIGSEWIGSITWPEWETGQKRAIEEFMRKE